METRKFIRKRPRSFLSLGLVYLCSSCAANELSYDEKSALILDQLRSNMTIVLLEAALDARQTATESSDSSESMPLYRMMDRDGQAFQCDVKVEGKRSLPTLQKEPGSDPHLQDSAILSHLADSLKGLCFTHNKEYWSYKWCFRSHVIQFHGQDPELSLSKNTHTPHHNLGKYINSKVHHPGEGMALTPISEFHENGDACNKTKRKTTVVFSCCPHQNQQRATVLSVMEETPCEYTIAVCVPVLCTILPSPNSVIAILENPTKKGSCTAMRNEGWWVYEFCYGKGLRQFHLSSETHMNAQNVKSRKIETEYWLGKYSAGFKQVEDKDGIRRDVTTADAPEKPPTFVLEYENGTECQVQEHELGEDQKPPPRRATTITLMCGVADVILSVVEDRTCHYQVLVSMKDLCVHPILNPPEPAIGVVKCSPVMD